MQPPSLLSLSFLRYCSHQHQEFFHFDENLLEQIGICRRTSSHGIIIKRKRTRYTFARQYVMPCESGRRSRDHRPTVKQRFFDVSSNQNNFFWKKSLNGHATVVGGHATVGRLSNNVFWTFQAIWENFEESRRTITRQGLRSRDRRLTVKQRFLDVSSN